MAADEGSRMQAGESLEVVHGPGPADIDGTRRWLVRGCVGPAPIRQGFVAVLTGDGGSVTAAVSSRLEVPLYYQHDSGALRWSTTVPGLVRQLAAPPPLNVGKLADLMALHDTADETALLGIRRLPIGHSLTWRPGRREAVVRRWFDPPTAEDRGIRPADAPRMMREAVRSAVEASLPPSGDVAATLSGGLDSSMVVASAAAALRGTGRAVHTVTHVPLPGTPDLSDVWEADDGPYARRMAAEVAGLTWHPLAHERRFSPMTAVAELLPITWSPVLNPANQVWMTDAVTYAASMGSPVLLTGATGNAPFSRDRAGLARQLAERRRYGQLLAEVLRRRRAGRHWAAAARAVLGEAASPPIRALRNRVRRHSPVPDADLFSARMPLRREALSDGAGRRLAFLDRPAPLSQQEWVDFVLRDSSLATEPQLPGTGVWWSDPLSDPEVETLALRLPLEAWLVGGMDRGLAREAARGLVPDDIRLRTTRGAQGADADQWLAGREQEYRDLLDRFRASPTVPEFVDLDRLTARLEDRMPTGSEAQLWEQTVGRAFGFGLFAVWYEDEILRRP